MRETVLVLDDDTAVCAVLARVLQESSYEVSTTCSMAQAVETVRSQQFDAYVLDYRLPDGSGLDLAKKLRETGNKSPIILMSGYGPSHLAERAANCGISEIVGKPFSKQSICETLRNSLAQAENHRAMAPDPKPPEATLPATPRSKGFSWPKWSRFG